ncbi:hypothetical protein BZG36_03762 [Bifiguratus adelaidae]|uniref:Aminoglycoside phosphotransferase domain-containing protein n=1 Tax=Bifiguratus adelaidae TaxID=1938954 RepID=A0A261Y0C4_9FUNG|nr:hypothetical protein BZG36_03762 [Bifiguratus adelaidae]
MASSEPDLPPEVQAILERQLDSFTMEHNNIGTNSFVSVLHTDKGEYVVKRARNTYAKKAIHREFDKLSILFPGHPGTFEVPEPVSSQESVYTVLKHIDGIDGSQVWAAANHSERLHLLKEIAAILKRIHACQVDGIEPLRATSRETSQSWYQSHLVMAKSLYNRRLAQEGTSPESQAALDNIAAMEHALADDGLWQPAFNTISFLHGDFMLPNVIFRQEDGILLAVGMVDWADCGYGDARYDLASMLWSIGYNSKNLQAKTIQEYKTASLAAYDHVYKDKSDAYFTPWK